MCISESAAEYLKQFIIILCIVQVNGSLLSRLKNPYEYLPLTTQNISFEDVSVNDINDAPIIEYGFEVPGPENSTALSSKTAGSFNALQIFITKEAKFKEPSLTSEADFYYYDRQKWPIIKLFTSAASKRFQTVVTIPIQYKKRTWPSYFPPKFISKLQSELDEALLPWKPTTPSISNVSSDSSKNLSDAFSFIKRSKRYEVEASCYMCGLNQRGIPLSTECYHAFEGEDERYRSFRRHLRVKCIRDSITKRVKRRHYGPDYIGGCFKRYLDVGIEYNERGCRTKEPTVGRSYASHRLASLEKMLRDTDEGCVFSPLASLTPFSRAVSLYVRYHVCVCSGSYCNHSPLLIQANVNLIFLLIYIYEIYK